MKNLFLFFFVILILQNAKAQEPSAQKPTEKQTLQMPALTDSSYKDWTNFYIEQYFIHNGIVDKPADNFPQAAIVGYQKGQQVWANRSTHSSGKALPYILVGAVGAIVLLLLVVPLMN